MRVKANTKYTQHDIYMSWCRLANNKHARLDTNKQRLGQNYHQVTDGIFKSDHELVSGQKFVKLVTFKLLTAFEVGGKLLVVEASSVGINLDMLHELSDPLVPEQG